MSSKRPPPPDSVAYLTGCYPKASHTFIQREIAAIRDLGTNVQTFSIRRPSLAELIGPEEEAAATETFYVLAAAVKNPIRLLSAHLGLIAKSPKRWLKALGLATRTARPGFKGGLRQGAYFLEAGLIAREMNAMGIAHLHNHFADSSCNVAMLVSSLSGIPFSFTLHGPTELFEPESWHLGEKVKRAAFTVCISHFCRSQAMLFSDPVDWDRLEIVHCGVNPVRYAVAPPSAKKALNLLFVGRLTPVKGLRVLMSAMTKVRATLSDVSLTLIGDGFDRTWAEAEALRIGGVVLLGYQSQERVAEELSKADAFVLPSFAEGVPVALMEAMAAARPVIATRVGGVSELVEHGVSGYMVAPGNPDELAEAILRLADSDRAAMGIVGRAKVVAEFDSRIEAGKLLALFQRSG